MSPELHGLPLLPRRARWVGATLVVAGLALAALRFRWGLRPAALDLRVFALHASFFESKSLAWIQKDMSGELAVAAILIGLCCLAFAREVRETAEIAVRRTRAWLIAVAVNTALLLLASFTLFGLAFGYVLVANLFSTLCVYLVVFRLLGAREVHDA